ncbi:Type 1 glutamine amidotransferase-like domain-containing protein [Candidatus Nomurabacteria bacterium]|nr:Type 1 glutamine amidotransferase-like domain-containing protein [Candidatus Nomurabacteria bacterium]
MKYIFHGGESGLPDSEHNKTFYQAWVADFETEYVPTILLVYYARTQDRWEEAARQDQERFDRYTEGNRKVNFIVADKDLDIFIQQIQQADVIYVRGGTTQMLLDYLDPVRDLFAQSIIGKLYIGSSAGLSIMCEYARSRPDHNSIWKRGFGIIPCVGFVHWDEDYREYLDTFKSEHPEYSDDQYLLIPETQWVVYEDEK